jgi:hypothetical protein
VRRGHLLLADLLIAALARERCLSGIRAQIDPGLCAVQGSKGGGALAAVGLGAGRVEREHSLLLTNAIPHRAAAGENETD